ncbi:hypothetical protein BU25DRAFT_233942 [Macroventuria anomochaeta]|uniref:Uncharacterized protein n=1 Tax=Macroventuria anomochaeta TaxID=301207 RepID=A0ACB6RJQ2_9PLEO|nr:uncharacterized protein BU25DRAFT_233942 [Macroventuria anomochaeta]KAF2621567.1 hypothetical protein BU25DRAFT_233942 [Macroventuria anomochaeta]
MALNPIACDNCRSKKCRCDRRVPSCSQCRASSLICRYQEGGKRGLPIAYINSLERRLRETESALYATMLALDEHDNIKASNIGLLKAPRELSKAERQDDWKRLPLQTPEQLAIWFQEKQQQAVPSEPDLPHIPFPGVPNLQPVESQSGEGPRMALPMPHTPGTDNTHSPVYSESASSILSKSMTEQLRGIETPQAPSTSAIPFKSTSWHNYF